ncbi:MAG: tRNA pseudouridine(13) synthase TruD [Anaerolineae bacterium]|nr:tRNA pseudouridine(13) synthase TruD [Anaerolineae bacterium]MDW8071176.1 tRNA pseudouridine(13) synthase TruD [Anaerolineae bacterium]
MHVEQHLGTTQSLPYLTEDYPGTGGRVRVQLDDFVVEEIPLYTPCGEGQHCYLFVEKRGISTLELVTRFARALGLPQRAIGYAGLKDARAVARQWLSVDSVPPERAAALQLEGVRILQVARHRNKLKLGHLAGNRFLVYIRDVPREALSIARAVLAELMRRGVPNYFGEQRFGQRDNTHWLGYALLRGDALAFVRIYLGRPLPDDPPALRTARALVEAGAYAEALRQWPHSLRDERRVLEALVRAGGDINVALRAVPYPLRRLALSAYQSHLFNRLLAQRIRTLDRLEAGDVAFIHASGAAFIVRDVVREQPRADRFEISPSGALFGPKCLLAEGAPGERERALLAETGLSLEEFRLPGIKLKGARRPYRVPLADVQVDWEDGLRLAFRLPPGSYATQVLREVMKA